MADVSSSGQRLQFCSNFARRQQQAVTLSQPDIETLRDWSMDLEVAYLIIESRDLAYSKTLPFQPSAADSEHGEDHHLGFAFRGLP